MHKRVDQPGVETAKGVRVEHALPLWHDGLGMHGKADAVEFDKAGRPYPVEYKHGSRHKAADIAACDDLQLAAQAMCLEAMTGFAIPEVIQGINAFTLGMRSVNPKATVRVVFLGEWFNPPRERGSSRNLVCRW